MTPLDVPLDFSNTPALLTGLLLAAALIDDTWWTWRHWRNG